MSPLAHLLRLTIRVYQWTIAPVLGANCRYEPSCSRFACDAIERHGALAGSVLAAGRLCRCHPWGGAGFDPVPDQSPFSFGRARPCDGAREQAR